MNSRKVKFKLERIKECLDNGTLKETHDKSIKAHEKAAIKIKDAESINPEVLRTRITL